jgi:hypothetical protein
VDSTNKDSGPDINFVKLAETISNSTLGEFLQDQQLHRGVVYDSLACSENQILREIGQQLQRGQILPRDIIHSDDYWDGLTCNLTESIRKFRMSLAALTDSHDQPSTAHNTDKI